MSRGAPKSTKSGGGAFFGFQVFFRRFIEAASCQSFNALLDAALVRDISKVGERRSRRYAEGEGVEWGFEYSRRECEEPCRSREDLICGGGDLGKVR